MKTITLTLVFIVASALPFPSVANGDEGIAPAFDAVQDTVFILHTTRSPPVGQIVDIDDMATVRNSYYDSTRPTFVLIHGMLGNRDGLLATLVVPTILRAGEYSNFSKLSDRKHNWIKKNCISDVFVVDWGSGEYMVAYK